MRRRFDFDHASFHFVFALIAALCLLILVFPSILILIISFTGEETLRFPPASYSVKWYVELWDAFEIQSAAWLSFKVALITTVSSIVLGSPARSL